MVCEGLTDRLEVANELVRLLKVDQRVNIIEVDSNFFSDTYFAERPNCERLINKNLNDNDLNIMRDWKIALKDYINDYYPQYIE